MDETRRSTLLSTLFSTWVVLGLFVDGWAHGAGRTETFWTPYHALLYSGFVAGTVTYGLERRRHRRNGTTPPSDPLTHAGFLLFALAGAGDAVWHSVFGVEEDIAALLSPTHLTLMLGGLFLVGGPLRRSSDVVGPGARRWRNAGPDVVAIVLTVAVVGFFLQFLSPFEGVQLDRYGAGAAEPEQLLGVASVLVTDVLILGGLSFAVARRRCLPRGSLMTVVAAPVVLWSSLGGFAGLELVIPAVLAGTVSELIGRRGTRPRAVLLVTPIVLWLGWFGVFHVRWGLGWPAEYWTGTTVLSVLAGWGLTLVTRTVPAPAATRPLVHPRGDLDIQPVGRGAPAAVTGG